MAKKRANEPNVENISLFLSNLKLKLKLSDKEFAKLTDQSQVKIPITIFSPDIGMLEAISLYLHDSLGLSFKLISNLLHRNYQTIWTSYRKAKLKLK